MKEPRRFAFVQYDVFTSQPLEGNQLAVFDDARGLSDAEMQALARETRLSETTFILPGDAATERAQGVKVRIFTVAEEMPFAGHPTLGTAFHLQRKSGASLVELDLKVGKIPVQFSHDDTGAVFGEMRQRDPQFGQIHAVEEVARVLGLEVADIDTGLPVQTVSTGLPFIMVVFRRLERLQRFKLDFARAAEYLDKTRSHFFYYVCRETVMPGAALHARMLFYNGEDPATGSAAGCCTAWAVRHGVFESEKRALIEQGIEMQRPSQIFVRGRKLGDAVTDIFVGGNVIPVSAGEFVI
jgi:trans-2,3-dihydro-3-hydroxyanthranilate isomerase